MPSQRISSNVTLTLAIFFPVFWMVFFGLLTITLFTSEAPSGTLPIDTAKWVMLAVYLSGAVILFLTLVRLRRVELSEDFVYVSNYFKTYRYPYSNVERLEISEFLFLRVGILHLRKPGHFGKRVRFIMSKFLYQDFASRHPDIASHLSASA